MREDRKTRYASLVVSFFHWYWKILMYAYPKICWFIPNLYVHIPFVMFNSCLNFISEWNSIILILWLFANSVAWLKFHVKHAQGSMGNKFFGSSLKLNQIKSHASIIFVNRILNFFDQFICWFDLSLIGNSWLEIDPLDFRAIFIIHEKCHFETN